MKKLVSQADLIKAEIEQLHERNRGNAEMHRLIEQIKANYKPLVYNSMQVLLRMLPEFGIKETVVEAGRGAGKSTAIADRVQGIVHEMPRSNSLLIGETYQQILTRTLPSTKAALERMGYFEGLHYFVGKQPPKSWKWDKPYQAPDEFGRFMWWYNGAGFTLISQDKKDDGRGLNSDAQIKDEAALLDREKLEANTDPTQRGSKYKLFKGKELFLSDFSCSTTPLTVKGNWFIEREEAALLHPHKTFFLKATCEVNKQNLPKDYLEVAKSKMIDWIYEAEYLNIRPRQIKNGFYPLLNEKTHTYNQYNYDHYSLENTTIDCRGDADLTAGQPLILGVDWGAAINSLVNLQHVGRELRALKSMYVLGDNQEIQSDLFLKWHNYYKYHQATNNTVYLWYDNMGNNSTGMTKLTRAQQAKKQLTALGWTVRLMTRGGRNPEHGAKHILWNAILKGDHPRLPIFRMNRSNCKDLWVSMFNAQAKMSSNDTIHKDKSSERHSSIQRQHATDLSDAVDAAVYGIFNKKMTGGGGFNYSTTTHTA